VSRQPDNRQPKAAVIALISECGRPVASRVRVARTFAGRLIGLLNHRRLLGEEGLLIEPGGAVHTFGMRFAIDVLFLDPGMRILKIAPAMQPACIAVAPAAAHYVLEIASGRAQSLGQEVGMRLLQVPLSAAPS